MLMAIANGALIFVLILILVWFVYSVCIVDKKNKKGG